MDAQGAGSAVRTPRTGHLVWLLWEYLFSSALTLMVGRKYLAFVPDHTSWVGWLGILAAFVSTSILLNLLPLTLAMIPALVLGRSWFTLGFCPFLFSGLVVFIYLDRIIYSLFRFHINGMILNLLTTKGASDSLTLGPATVISGVTAIALIVFAQLAFSVGLVPFMTRRRLVLRPRRFFALVGGLLVAIVVTDKALFVYGDYTNRPELTRARHLLPFYRPVVMRDFISKHLGVDPAVEANLKLNYGANALFYPRAPLVFPEGGPKPNVVIVAIEGCRFDMLDPEVMPFLHRWSQTQLSFARHYSGGNVSRFGVFSLLYGIYGTYWHRFLSERQGPVLIDELKKFGYGFRVLAGADLNYPEFRKTAFLEIPSSITDQWTCERTDRDRVMTDLFARFLDEGRKPFFSFLFYDASHQPYLYPPEHKIFGPVPDKHDIDYTKLDDDHARKAVLIGNRYKNSLHYIDSQLERLVDALDRRGLLDNTLVFITGDHGEEFNEVNFIGHGTTFDRYQTSTLMVAHVPGAAPGRVERITSHIDVVPTIFSYMGVKNPISDYSEGSPLTGTTGAPYAVVANWDSAALIDETSTVVFGTESTNIEFEVFDANYKPVIGDLTPRRDMLLDLIRKMGEFSR